MGKVPTGKTITYINGTWHNGNPMVIGPRHHAMWLASVVFDGARAFNGYAPDLDRHCERAVNSARLLGMDVPITAGEIEELAWEGIRRFPRGAHLYICPMFYAEEGFVMPEPDSTRFVLSIYETPVPEPVGFSACKSSYRRPARDMAPTEAKASCLYPNVARIGREAGEKGFDTAVVMDPAGNIAEFAHTNLFMVKDGVVHTPAINGTFLNGITRQRVIKLLRGDGVEVVERSIDFDELLDADEIFSTANYAKVQPCTKIEDKALEPGPLFKRAYDLYFDWAKGTGP